MVSKYHEQEMYGMALTPYFIQSRWETLAKQHGVGPKQLERGLRKQKVGGLDMFVQ